LGDLPYDESSPISMISKVNKRDELLSLIELGDSTLTVEQTTETESLFKHSTKRVVDLCRDLMRV